LCTEGGGGKQVHEEVFIRLCIGDAGIHPSLASRSILGVLFWYSIYLAEPSSKKFWSAGFLMANHLDIAHSLIGLPTRLFPPRSEDPAARARCQLRYLLKYHSYVSISPLTSLIFFVGHPFVSISYSHHAIKMPPFFLEFRRDPIPEPEIAHFWATL
jgi:hypothetical protein